MGSNATTRVSDVGTTFVEPDLMHGLFSSEPITIFEVIHNSICWKTLPNVPLGS